jgi:hypothetical protein
VGFNRETPAADVVFSYVVSQDTGIRVGFDPGAVAASVTEEAALADYMSRKGWGAKLATSPAEAAEIDAEARRILAADPVLRGGIVEKARIGAVLDALYAEYGPSVRVARNALEGLGSLDAVVRQSLHLARSVKHRKYRETGEESELGLAPKDDSVIRFRLHNLTPAERAEAKGRLRETDPEVSSFRHLYDVNAWILRRTLVGAVGWGGFQADPTDKHVSEKSLASLDEEWVIELGDFVLELAELRRQEKKA